MTSIPHLTYREINHQIDLVETIGGTTNKAITYKDVRVILEDLDWIKILGINTGIWSIPYWNFLITIHNTITSIWNGRKMKIGKQGYCIGENFFIFSYSDIEIE